MVAGSSEPCTEDGDGMASVDTSCVVLVAGSSAPRMAEDFGVMDVSDDGRRPSLDGFRGVLGDCGSIGTTGTRGTGGLGILLCSC